MVLFSGQAVDILTRYYVQQSQVSAHLICYIMFDIILLRSAEPDEVLIKKYLIVRDFNLPLIARSFFIAS